MVKKLRLSLLSLCMVQDETYKMQLRIFKCKSYKVPTVRFDHLPLLNCSLSPQVKSEFLDNVGVEIANVDAAIRKLLKHCKILNYFAPGSGNYCSCSESSAVEHLEKIMCT